MIRRIVRPVLDSLQNHTINSDIMAQGVNEPKPRDARRGSRPDTASMTPDEQSEAQIKQEERVAQSKEHRLTMYRESLRKTWNVDDEFFQSHLSVDMYENERALRSMEKALTYGGSTAAVLSACCEEKRRRYTTSKRRDYRSDEWRPIDIERAAVALKDATGKGDKEVAHTIPEDGQSVAAEGLVALSVTGVVSQQSKQSPLNEAHSPASASIRTSRNPPSGPGFGGSEFAVQNAAHTHGARGGTDKDLRQDGTKILQVTAPTQSRAHVPGATTPQRTRTPQQEQISTSGMQSHDEATDDEQPRNDRVQTDGNGRREEDDDVLPMQDDILQVQGDVLLVQSDGPQPLGDKGQTHNDKTNHSDDAMNMGNGQSNTKARDAYGAQEQFTAEEAQSQEHEHTMDEHMEQATTEKQWQTELQKEETDTDVRADKVQDGDEPMWPAAEDAVPQIFSVPSSKLPSTSSSDIGLQSQDVIKRTHFVLPTPERDFCRRRSSSVGLLHLQSPTKRRRIESSFANDWCTPFKSAAHEMKDWGTAISPSVQSLDSSDRRKTLSTQLDRLASPNTMARLEAAIERFRNTDTKRHILQQEVSQQEQTIKSMEQRYKELCNGIDSYKASIASLPTDAPKELLDMWRNQGQMYIDKQEGLCSQAQSDLETARDKAKAVCARLTDIEDERKEARADAQELRNKKQAQVDDLMDQISRLDSLLDDEEG